MVKHELTFDDANCDLFDDAVLFGNDCDVRPVPADYDEPPEPILRRHSSSYKSNRRSSTGSSSSRSSTCSSSSRTRHKAGQQSYADLITRAISSSPESRMTLSQIYDWMVDNVNGLQEQRSLHSSKGWKNAVRHTLSINPRFKRIQRQGRPGLWMIDPASYTNRFHCPLSLSGSSSAVTSAAGGSAAQSIVSHLNPSEDGTSLETDHFVLRAGTLPAGYNTYAVQTINVIDEDDTVTSVTLQNPIRIKLKAKTEACTQTESSLFNNHDTQQQQLSVNDSQGEKDQGYKSKHQCFRSVSLEIYPQQQAHSSVQDKDHLLQQHVLSLPDDLRDISLDPSLDCNDVLRDQYWF